MYWDTREVRKVSLGLAAGSLQYFDVNIAAHITEHSYMQMPLL